LPPINDFDAFPGFGGWIDPCVDRRYDQSLDPENPRDKPFIDLLEDLNQTLIETGWIKPTMMFGAFRPRNSGHAEPGTGRRPRRPHAQLLSRGRENE